MAKPSPSPTTPPTPSGTLPPPSSPPQAIAHTPRQARVGHPPNTGSHHGERSRIDLLARLLGDQGARAHATADEAYEHKQDFSVSGRRRGGWGHCPRVDYAGCKLCGAWSGYQRQGGPRCRQFHGRESRPLLTTALSYTPRAPASFLSLPRVDMLYANAVVGCLDRAMSLRGMRCGFDAGLESRLGWDGMGWDGVCVQSKVRGGRRDVSIQI